METPHTLRTPFHAANGFAQLPDAETGELRAVTTDDDGLLIIQADPEIRWANGDTVPPGELPAAQRAAIYAAAARHGLTEPIEIGHYPCDDCVMVRVSPTLELGIETDGHTHS